MILLRGTGKRQEISFKTVISMKVVSIMNFVRQIDEREEHSTRKLLAFTAEQLQLVKEYGVDHTFLLQYDALCDEDRVPVPE